MHKSRPFNATFEGWAMASLIAWSYRVPLWIAIVCTVFAALTIVSWIIDRYLDRLERKLNVGGE